MRVEHLNFLPPNQPECPHFLSIAMSISLNTLKLHNERLDKLIKQLEANYAWKPIHPKEPIESIMYRAGQASVIEYINSIMEDEI
jgi:hypothetical protein